jgi:hypothetical protein
LKTGIIALSTLPSRSVANFADKFMQHMGKKRDKATRDERLAKLIKPGVQNEVYRNG